MRLESPIAFFFASLSLAPPSWTARVYGRTEKQNWEKEGGGKNAGHERIARGEQNSEPKPMFAI